MAFALLDHTEEKTTINEILTGTFREKDRQINFAIAELEKVKAEIIGSCNNIAQEVSDLSYTRKIYVYEQLSEIKGAIDKHISELKGENK